MTINFKEISIVWHSRAGQGAVTAANVLAQIIGNRGNYVQSFPEFGAEKRGAPVKVFNRFSESEILDVSPVNEADFIVILDRSLLENELSWEKVLKDCHQKETVFLLNTSEKNAKKDSENFQKLFSKNSKLQAATMFTVDASGIAIQEIGRDIPNVAILGALLNIFLDQELLSLSRKADKKKDLELFRDEIKAKLGKLPEKIVEGNLRAFMRGARCDRFEIR